MCLKHVKMIKIKLICHVQEIHEICPPLLTYPGWHTHGHTLIETDAIHWSGGQPITAPREHGGLLKGTSAVARRWTDTPLAVSFTNL